MRNMSCVLLDYFTKMKTTLLENFQSVSKSVVGRSMSGCSVGEGASVRIGTEEKEFCFLSRKYLLTPVS